MDPRVEEYLKKAIENEKAEAAKKRERVLIEAGLCKKEFSDKRTEDAVWDGQALKYYTQKAIEVTDEEYEEILKHRPKKGTPKEHGKTNSISSAIKVIAIILFVVGFIVGIIMGFYNLRYGRLDGNEYNFLVSLIVWIVSAINGVLILGFSEIIQLLEDIKNKK